MFSLLHGKERSNLTLCIDDSSNPLLRVAVCKELHERNGSVAMFCYQESIQWYQTHLLLDQARAHYFDGFSDPLGWCDMDMNSASSVGVKSTLIRDVTSCGVSVTHDNVLFIDDLLLFGRSRGLIDNNGRWNDLLNVLVDISNDIPIYIFANSELLSGGDLRSLLYKSSSHIKFIVQDSCANRQYKCESIVKKHTGKVSTEVISVQLIMNGRMTKIDQDAEVKRHSEEVDPASNLTFNLRLTDTEKEARSSTVLPYIIKDENKAAFLNNTQKSTISVGEHKGGEVIYTPDDFDDFDDEDPDDDLDI